MRSLPFPAIGSTRVPWLGKRCLNGRANSSPDEPLRRFSRGALYQGFIAAAVLSETAESPQGLVGEAELAHLMATTPIQVTSLGPAAALGGQQLAQYRLQLVGQQLTARLNKKIAQLKDQAQDPMLPVLQGRVSSLNNQKAPYSTALDQMSGNNSAISDMKIQLGNASLAASLGDAAGFDQAMAAAQSDVDILGVVPNLPGFQPDGIGNLKLNGLGIQSSSVYDLTTAAGRAQAIADVQGAQNTIDQIFAFTTQNQAIATTISQLIDSQVSDLNDQISSRQQSEVIDAANQIARLQQQTQTQFHLVELAFGAIAQPATALATSRTPAAGGSAPLTSILDTLA